MTGSLRFAYGGILSRKKRSAQKKIITTSKLVV